MSHGKCVVCPLPGTPRTCCPDEPRLCPEHYDLHRRLTHAGVQQRRSVDEALLATLTEEGFED